MRLYADENFSQPVVNRLRELGHDVLTTRDVGKAEQRIPDPEVLQYATDIERVLLTFNKWDFVNLHERMPNHAGIIACTEDRDIEGLAQRIHIALEANPDMKGKLVRIKRPNLLSGAPSKSG
jgi:predicted nuclease of predicted toxin-antitoxin system